MSELPADRAARLQRELAISADSAHAARLPRRARRLLRGCTRRRRRARARSADARQLGHRRAARAPRRRRGARPIARSARRARGARRDGRGTSVSASARPARCSTGWWPTAATRSQIVEAEGLAAIDGGDELAGIVAAALEANPDAAERVREGNAKAIGPIVGHVMRETKGRADGDRGRAPGARAARDLTSTSDSRRVSRFWTSGQSQRAAVPRQDAVHEPVSSQPKRLISSAVHPAARGTGGRSRHGRRVRRYQLTSVGQARDIGTATPAVREITTARIARRARSGPVVV